MVTLSIDQEKCRRDGLCVSICPSRLIELKEGDGFPAPSEKFEERCINCGHCMAVCPHGALALSTMKPEQCRVIRKDDLPTSYQVITHLKARRSIRSFKDSPVPREELERLLDTARYAPSGHNAQSVQWLVVYDTEELRRLSDLVVDALRLIVRNQPEFAQLFRAKDMISAYEAGVKRICWGAPHLIVAYAHKDDPGGHINSTIALSYLEITAPAMGLGACWGGLYGLAASNHPPFIEALGLPDNHTAHGAMLVGYPGYRFYRIPLRNPIKILWR